MNSRPETTAFWWGVLPHWEVTDGRYFVTVHLAGAIPAAGRERVRSEIGRLREAVARGQTGHWQRLRITAEVEAWLDRAPACTLLAQPAVAAMVSEAVEHRAHAGVWDVFEYVVMPSHIHLFLRLKRGRLKEAVEGLKTWTGSRIARLVPERGGGPVWQKEWFDHWSRSLAEDDRIQAYIRQNPVKAGLVNDWRQWPWSSWFRK